MESNQSCTRIYQNQNLPRFTRNSMTTLCKNGVITKNRKSMKNLHRAKKVFIIQCFFFMVIDVQGKRLQPLPSLGEPQILCSNLKSFTFSRRSKKQLEHFTFLQLNYNILTDYVSATVNFQFPDGTLYWCCNKK